MAVTRSAIRILHKKSDGAQSLTHSRYLLSPYVTSRLGNVMHPPNRA
jgi:hypothetical protein